VIRIEKPETPPEKLLTDGKNKRKTHASAYSRDPIGHQSGVKKFAFDRAIYADPTVKQALINAQHKKCCFCEVLIGQDGDVEHFRPKAAYRQAPGDPLQYPGYYWLAYEWKNLYLACPGCNQRHKKNLFPLQNPHRRATDHRQNQELDREQPLFIDPGKENPEDFIAFQGVVAFAINDNPRGNATIAALKLNDRDGLKEDRRQRLHLLCAQWTVIQTAAAHPENLALQALADRAKTNLQKQTQDNMAFAAAARSALATDFRYVIG
jgi:uncharacterized protein (TIGR02646 family)